MYFLKPERRMMLIRNLRQKCGMPKMMAEDHASYTAKGLDNTLAALVYRMAERVEMMREAAERGNDQARRQHEVFLECDFFVFGAYVAELHERRVPMVVSFPRTNRAVRLAVQDLDHSKIAILEALSKGPLQ